MQDWGGGGGHCKRKKNVRPGRKKGKNGREMGRPKTSFQYGQGRDGVLRKDGKEGTKRGGQGHTGGTGGNVKGLDKKKDRKEGTGGPNYSLE